MRRRTRYTLPVKKNSTFSLNITSMTDMFTIMLVFLLQTFTTSDVQIEPGKDLRLPASNTTANPIEGVRLSISKDSIKLDDKILANLKDLQVDGKDVDPKDRSFIPSLFDELDRLAKSMEAGSAKEAKVLLQADESLPYETIRKVMYTSSMAGFPQLKLVTVVGE